jgi:general secretion pathway protein G
MDLALGRYVGSRKGITLTEIAIAIAVLALLAVLVLPSYAHNAVQARKSQAVQDIARIETLIERYRAENGLRLPESLDQLGASIPLDPWGNAYQYVNIEANVELTRLRLDPYHFPLNSDYDLYSMGADGRSALQISAGPARDDIVRAGNGRFIGLAADY